MSTDSPAKPPLKSAAKPARPPLGGIGIGGLGTDDIDPIRQYGLSKGFLPTETELPAPQPAISQPAIQPAPQPQPAPASAIVRPAPTRPWQAMLPDYLVEELRQAAAREGTAQKVIVLKALRQAGFRIDDIDLQDLRRR
ncbi:hypothetical protein J2848_005794 [Azospirillum lipoferum]|uniref:Uncharacterized protein n=1 Tax=Azospirillum lipoferum TaxID=193 RepID=A0A5A9GJF7_AZOLI|nr:MULTISPECIES: hypothetical protein [Azospirillum]KAA0593842.1 hypothetical protein FZ942_23485 [Azospirillum lipoferum]MCP1614091.1 hypothetical protein [Azospirillum lipoferum]MDW5536780.1 hypothetical protein [Azospirillum sp. NL1]